MKKKDIRLEIMQLRIEHGMSQAELAKKVDVSQRSVSMWENGEAFPRNITCIKLANAFGLPRNYFISEAEVPQNDGDVQEAYSTEVAEAIDKLIEHYGDMDTVVSKLAEFRK